ncbi:MAG TPA: Dyp-type peroxidase [Solirubrobacterales bacterium]|nr:Dyp-type peroxidase [Solirubrobacterales bacterium]
MTDARPQDILTPITESAIFLTVCVDPGGEEVVKELLPDLGGLRRSVGFRAPEARLSCIVGIGSELWDRLFGEPRPAGLHPFRELRGERHTAPATPGDLFFHIRADRLDMCFGLAQLLGDRLGPHLRIIDEVHGFKSFDERDLLGFVDGTENPEGVEASAAVLIEDEDPAFAGGSYLIVQKYSHDLEAWNALTVEQQEAAFGRTKLDDVEFADEDKAPDSHLTLNVIEDEDGEQLQIMRYNMPFGRIGTDEFGTFYIAYARTPAVTERMLENMFLGLGDATHDRILDFSTAHTGNLFFVPSADFLDDPAVEGDDEGDGAAAGAAAAEPAAGDGSLGIGDLRGADR